MSLCFGGRGQGIQKYHLFNMFVVIPYSIFHFGVILFTNIQKHQLSGDGFGPKFLVIFNFVVEAVYKISPCRNV